MKVLLEHHLLRAEERKAIGARGRAEVLSLAHVPKQG
jgi:hypothetical protein